MRDARMARIPSLDRLQAQPEWEMSVGTSFEDAIARLDAFERFVLNDTDCREGCCGNRESRTVIDGKKEPVMRVVFTGVTSIGLVLSISNALLAADSQRTVLIEAEGFERLGGWVVDQQYMDQMGSPVLLAHGLGRPVEDAMTSVELPAAGTYRIWVRTRDWAATFHAPGTPGRFQLLVNGEAMQTTFGSEGAEWHWQDGGTVNLPARKITLALHDLTGFDGRCDAIVLTADASFVPPNDSPRLADWRRRLLGLPETPPDAGPFDFVVVGGGMAGCSACLRLLRTPGRSISSWSAEEWPDAVRPSRRLATGWKWL